MVLGLGGAAILGDTLHAPGEYKMSSIAISPLDPPVSTASNTN